MTIHIIFIFSLILTIILTLIFVIFYAHYSKLKNNKNYTSQYKNKMLLGLFIIFFFAGLSPIILLEIVTYIILFLNQDSIVIYLFFISAIINYILIIVYLLSLTFFMNSLWIKVDNMFIHFLDESVYLNEIIGIKPGKLINYVIFEIEGETNKKRVIGKKIATFLTKVDTNNIKEK